MENDLAEINLAWTGGWDSTFLLLQHLLKEKREVQIYYLMRSEESSGQEIDTMVKIRRYLSRNYPNARYRLKPFKIIDMDEISIPQSIENRYQDLCEGIKINKQYRDLAALCVQFGINNVELGIVGPLKEYEPDFPNLRGEIFGKFSFPAINLSKKRMDTISRENEWLDIMRLTTFCRKPKNGKPCGYCGPCVDAVSSGLGWRLPLKARLIANIIYPFRNWWRKNYNKQSVGLLAYIPRIFKYKI